MSSESVGDEVGQFVDVESDDEDTEDEYSDSEEEDGPHFDMVYNHTKMFGSGSNIVNNVVGIDKVERYRKMSERIAGSGNGTAVEVSKVLWGSDLADDARTIHNAIPNSSIFNKNKGGTTVLCVALEEKRMVLPRVKLFLFTNLVLPPLRSMLDMASALGYHVIQTQESHAEAALLQFLQERRNTYKTEPPGIGSHRKTCEICKLLLNQPFFEVEVEIQLPLDKNGGDKTNPLNFRTPPALMNILDEQVRRGLDRKTYGLHWELPFDTNINPLWAKLTWQYQRLTQNEFNFRKDISKNITHLRKKENMSEEEKQMLVAVAAKMWRFPIPVSVESEASIKPRKCAINRNVNAQWTKEEYFGHIIELSEIFGEEFQHDMSDYVQSEMPYKCTSTKRSKKETVNTSLFSNTGCPDFGFNASINE